MPRRLMILAQVIALVAILPLQVARADHNATALVSAGQVNGNGAFTVIFEGASQDGSRAFFITEESLVAADTDGFEDIYERSEDVTTLISAGQVNGNGAFNAYFRDISQDGGRVFFGTDEPLVTADTDAREDIYERSSGVTTLISAGQVNGNGAFNASFKGASQDGSRVFFRTEESLVSTDTDGARDVYVASAVRVGLSTAAPTVSEGTGAGGITVTLDARAFMPVTVDYAVTSGSATPGKDFTLTAGTLTFSPGDDSESISFAILEDFLVETGETFVVALSNPGSAYLATAAHTVTINDNEPNLACGGSPATIVETAAGEAISGTSGDDVVAGRGGDDVICGGPGADTLNGGPGNDLLFGQSETDLLRGQADDDDLRGGAGNDFVRGGGGNDNLLGGPGADALNGQADNDELRGGGGAPDRCLGGPGVDILLVPGHGCEVTLGVP